MIFGHIYFKNICYVIIDTINPEEYFLIILKD